MIIHEHLKQAGDAAKTFAITAYNQITVTAGAVTARPATGDTVGAYK